MNHFLKPLLLMFAGTFLLLTFCRAQLCTTKEAYAKKNIISFPDTSKTVCLAENFYLWDVGQTILIRFMNGSREEQERVMKIAREWEKYANIKFKQAFAEPSNIRVEFCTEKENYSMIGSDANQEDPKRATMRLEWALFNNEMVLRSMVLHQFGHVLGFLHEHRRPEKGIQWNKEAVYKHFETLGWNREITDRQVFEVSNYPYSNGIRYDSASIMQFPIAKWQTTDAYENPLNNQLSEGDRQIAGLMYPFSGVRANEVPRINILNYTTTKIKADKDAGGINLYPSFNIQTAGAMGDIYLAVMLYNKEGMPIMATDEKYNVSGVVGSCKKFRMGPGKKLSVNKQNPEEFLLFIPYSNIPNTLENSEIQVIFRAYASDGKDLKSIFFSNPVSYQMGSR